MFFKNLKPKSAMADRADHQLAEQLYQALSTKRGIFRKPKMFTWAREFTKLAESVEREDIKKVLNWYCQNIKKPYVPLAFSAASFCSKFPSIEEAMKRDQPNQTEINDLAREIWLKIAHLNFPNSTPEQRLQTIQISLNNYQDFIARLSKARTPFALHLMRFVPDAPTYVRTWMEEIYKMIASFDDWKGEITKQAFTYDCKRFKGAGRLWAVGYCGDQSQWDKLIESIYDDA